MSSPFSTIEEFNNAIDGPTEGAIYTFADKPMLNNIALLVAVGIFVWFIIKTYATHAARAEPSGLDNSLNRLSSVIVIGLLSLVAADYRQASRPEQPAQRQQTGVLQSSRRAAPLGLLGMISMGLPPFRHAKIRHAKNRKGRQPAITRKLSRRSSRYR